MNCLWFVSQSHPPPSRSSLWFCAQVCAPKWSYTLWWWEEVLPVGFGLPCRAKGTWGGGTFDDGIILRRSGTGLKVTLRSTLGSRPFSHVPCLIASHLAVWHGSAASGTIPWLLHTAVLQNWLYGESCLQERAELRHEMGTKGACKKLLFAFLMRETPIKHGRFSCAKPCLWVVSARDDDDLVDLPGRSAWSLLAKFCLGKR